MKCFFTLSSICHDGRRQILMQMFVNDQGRRLNMRAKSEIFVHENFFDPQSATGISQGMISARRVAGEEVTYHREQHRRMAALLDELVIAFESADKKAMDARWLAEFVHGYHHPRITKEDNPSFAKLSEEYVIAKRRNLRVARQWASLTRTVMRYERFVQLTKNPDYMLLPRETTNTEINELRNYLLTEVDLQRQYPIVFARILKEAPAEIRPRGENTVAGRMKKLRAFFNWCREAKGYTNTPFKGVYMGRENYGTPNYLSLNERKQVAQAEMPTEHLSLVRDIFIFQCLVGCRVGDMELMTEECIVDGVLVYTPMKTQYETSVQARVPLAREALDLVAKYRGKDKRGRLFPFMTVQKYNEAIKVMLLRAGITRMVEVRNSLTGMMERKPLCDIASSHLARRTFVGNLYFRVQDPCLIGKMSGHVEGSKAFSRYRPIEDATLADAIKLIE